MVTTIAVSIVTTVMHPTTPTTASSATVTDSAARLLSGSGYFFCGLDVVKDIIHMHMNVVKTITVKDKGIMVMLLSYPPHDTVS